MDVVSEGLTYGRRSPDEYGYAYKDIEKRCQILLIPPLLTSKNSHESPRIR